ncbi:unnamed protein product [Haemonchus placei]|uniref:Kinesin motor domain-containing protein n=1 Tax=Haemonchus placei TaxID=6290 RepID=A0A0N4WYC1_HAEPC|nr:unnamed protein product [Haemonchus placei]
MCLDTATNRRAFMKKVALMDMISEEYVYVDINADDVDPNALKEFQAKVVARMATWARHLHDVFYLYGLSLNDSLTLDPINGVSNATALSQSMERSFLGE